MIAWSKWRVTRLQRLLQLRCYKALPINILNYSTLIKSNQNGSQPVEVIDML
jgi:hypothetical protein